MIPDKTPTISLWQREQRDALRLVSQHLETHGKGALARVQNSLGEYLAFRETLDTFLDHHINPICVRECYTTQKSACCGKDSIIIFFAEVVINAMVSDKSALNYLETILEKPNPGKKCIFLGTEGCLWQLRPIVCAFFLCDMAEASVLSGHPSLEKQWENLKKRERSFKWPDRKVLFDEIEKVYISSGYSSPLMYCHNSPGLLRVKKSASSA